MSSSATAGRGRRPRSSPSGGDRGGGLGRSASAGPPPDREPDVPADPESVARTIVLNQLSVSAKSRHQLETKLAQRDVPADVAARVLDRMTEVGLVDDAAYAQEWVRQRQQGKGLARRALADELRRKGIADDHAQDALATVDEATERAAALALAERKARSSRGQPHDKRVRSLAGMLARKGYGAGMAFDVVREVLAAEGAVEDSAAHPDFDL